MIAVSDDWHIIRNCKNRLVIHMLKLEIAVLIYRLLYMSAKFNLITILWSAKLERITVLKPGIRYLYLETIDDLLLEHTVTITDSAAICCISERCKRIHKAGCQTSETTITKCRIRLLILNNAKVKTDLLECFLHFLVSTQIDQVVTKRTPHQEFHGHIVQCLWIFPLHCLLRSHPLIHNNLFDCK